MGTQQPGIRDNFPACWTAWEIANQKMKNKIWREMEDKLQEEGVLLLQVGE